MKVCIQAGTHNLLLVWLQMVAAERAALPPPPGGGEEADRTRRETTGSGDRRDGGRQVVDRGSAADGLVDVAAEGLGL